MAADHDRTFAVEVIDRESNAVEGKHYKILSNTVTIKAGERSTNLEVQGIYDNLELMIRWFCIATGNSCKRNNGDSMELKQKL